MDNSNVVLFKSEMCRGFIDQIAYNDPKLIPVLHKKRNKGFPRICKIIVYVCCRSPLSEKQNGLIFFTNELNIYTKQAKYLKSHVKLWPYAYWIEY